MIIIDRIEDGVAVLETEEDTFLQIPASQLPTGAREGSVLIYKDGEYLLDAQTEAARRDRLFRLQQMLLGED
ncbi:MAG: DUF3006 domain-containing protein [Clostridia bacterium]|nr:DUF3006 domain-containing protein [Clostridia bacterium]